MAEAYLGDDDKAQNAIEKEEEIDALPDDKVVLLGIRPMRRRLPRYPYTNLMSHPRYGHLILPLLSQTLTITAFSLWKLRNRLFWIWVMA